MADNGSGGRYAYRASKAALNIINKSMSLDLQAEGVTCVLLHPGTQRHRASLMVWLPVAWEGCGQVQGLGLGRATLDSGRGLAGAAYVPVVWKSGRRVHKPLDHPRTTLEAMCSTLLELLPFAAPSACDSAVC